MNVFITRVIPARGVQVLEEAGISVSQWTEKRDLSSDELIQFAREHDALLCAGFEKLDAALLQACRHLKVISLFSVGFDNVDLKTVNQLKIPVGHTPGVLSGATADTAFLLMLAASRKAFYLHRKIGNGQWGFYDPAVDLGIELTGKTLGILGLGKIGLEMARRCVGAYAMNVIYHNRSTHPEAEKELNARKVSFDELLAQSDVLSVHTSLTPETRGLFNKSVFQKMKQTALFINTARGAIHNEKDLTEALQNGLIWGAGLDVTNPEPMAPDNPLLTMPSVAILPHIGSTTVETRDAMAIIAARNVIAGLQGIRLPHVVNPEIYV
ncbi:D-glycerate dehydrogenase [Larkinella harenae]